MSSCTSYDGCVGRTRQTLAYPTDQESLYADRIYDNQAANRRCYEKNPIEIKEGFGKRRINRMIRWIIIIIILYILITMLMQFMRPRKTFTVDFTPMSIRMPTGRTIEEIIPKV